MRTVSLGLCWSTGSLSSMTDTRAAPRADEGEAAALDIDLRHDIAREGNEHGRAAARGLHLDQIAGAEILDGDDGADGLALPIDRGEPDQLGVVPLLLFALGQAIARDIELGAVKRLGALARRDALDAGDQRLGRDAEALDLDDAAVSSSSAP